MSSIGTSLQRIKKQRRYHEKLRRFHSIRGIDSSCTLKNSAQPWYDRASQVMQGSMAIIGWQGDWNLLLFQELYRNQRQKNKQLDKWVTKWSSLASAKSKQQDPGLPIGTEGCEKLLDI